MTHFDVGFSTNYEALQLDKVPVSLIVIGAGYVGVEFAQMYSRYGIEPPLNRCARDVRKNQKTRRRTG